jgi:hypothetical protein
VNRTRWPTPSEQSLRSELRSADKESFVERSERLRFVYGEFGPPPQMLLVGGFPAMFAIHEMQVSFVAGNYLSTILTAQTFVEHTLGGWFRLAGDDTTPEQGFAKLINASLQDRSIDATIAERLHELRQMRNPYIHPQAFVSKRGYMKRLSEHGYEPHAMARADAEAAIQIVVDYLRYGSPTWAAGATEVASDPARQPAHAVDEGGDST